MIATIYFEKDNTMKIVKKNQWLPGWGRNEQVEHIGFQGSESTLYNPIMADACLYNLLKATECTAQRESPNVNDEHV